MKAFSYAQNQSPSLILGLENVSLGHLRSVGGDTFDPANRANANTSAAIIINSAEMLAGGAGAVKGAQCVNKAGGLFNLGSGGITSGGALIPVLEINGAAVIPAIGAGAAVGVGVKGSTGLAKTSLKNPDGSPKSELDQLDQISEAQKRSRKAVRDSNISGESVDTKSGLIRDKTKSEHRLRNKLKEEYDPRDWEEGGHVDPWADTRGGSGSGGSEP